MALDLDGEQPGLLPVRIAIVPRALRVRVGGR
jgi:diacylglycerol kinase family enzyme